MHGITYRLYDHIASPEYDYLNCSLLVCNSVVECQTVNLEVVGSRPTRPALRI